MSVAGSLPVTAPIPVDGEAARRAAAPLLIGAALAAVVAGRVETLALAAVVALAAALAARARWPGGRAAGALLTSAGLAIALNLYLVPGRSLPLPTVAGAAATWEGLAQGAGFAVRILVAAIAVHGLRAAWPGEQAADELADRARGLERFGVPVRRVRAMMGLAIRFAPLLGDEVRRIAAIQAQRAGRPPRGPAERLERLRAVLIPSLVASLERAGQVGVALEARHYRLRDPERMPRAPWWARLAGWSLAGLGLLWR